MRKKLVPIGNSRALVINKSFLRMLGIEDEPFVQISIEGHRLMVERSTSQPEPRNAVEPPLEITPAAGISKIVKRLDHLGMGSPEFVRLSEGARIGLFLANVEAGRAIDAVTEARLRLCLDRRQTIDESWDATIDVVLAQLPATTDSAM